MNYHDLADLKFFLDKRSKKSARFITCSICGKTITKKSMVSHFFNFHKDFKND